MESWNRWSTIAKEIVSIQSEVYIYYLTKILYFNDNNNYLFVYLLFHKKFIKAIEKLKKGEEVNESRLAEMIKKT